MTGDDMEETKLDISHAQVHQSVEALQKLIKEKSDSNALIKEADTIHLQFSLKKIPIHKQQIIKLKLPNGLQTNREVCLFVRDIDQDREYEKSVRQVKQRLKEEDIDYVSQVIPLKALKLEYKPYEAKRKLSNSFDVFLADATIIRLLPPFLGKAFYGRKRFPIQVRMDSKDLKEEFETAISSSRCIYSGKGSVGMASVGTSDMSVAELVQNITASAEQITTAMPGGAGNIRSMYIKTDTSLGVPVYMCLGSANDVQLPATAETKAPVEVGEVTTVEGALVKVYPSGVVKVIDHEGKVVEELAKGVKQAGKRRKGVKRAGKISKDVKRAGKKGKDVKTTGKKSKDVKTAGEKSTDVKTAGKKSTDVKTAGKKSTDVKTAGSGKSRTEKDVKLAEKSRPKRAAKKAEKTKQPPKAVKRAGKRK